MERLLFKKIEVWLVLVLVLVCVAGALAYGMVVHDVVQGKRRLGPLAPVVRDVASAHTVLRQAVRDWQDPSLALRANAQRFEGASGFDFAYAPGERPGAPYLLLNRYDGDRTRSVSELVDLDSQTVVHEWVYEVTPVWRESTFESPFKDLMADDRSYRFRGVHALPDPNGDLVVQGMSTPLLKLDLCGALVWEQSGDAYHHSIERDAAGNYWVPASLTEKTVAIGGSDFRDDALMQIAPDGTVLSARSVIEILDDNGLGWLVYGDGFAQADPIHLNDIQPVNTDGVLWRRGDLLLSLRNLSMVLLYRPSTGEILWHRAGPPAWLHQHDVDILDDRRISVFDNHARLRGQQDLEPVDVNRRIVMDVTTGEWTSTHAEGFQGLDIRTGKQGLHELMPDGTTLFVEETSYGRAAAFRADGQTEWSYVNRAPGDGRIFTLNWSRIVPRETGDAIRALRDAGTCDEAAGNDA